MDRSFARSSHARPPAITSRAPVAPCGRGATRLPVGTPRALPKVRIHGPSQAPAVLRRGRPLGTTSTSFLPRPPPCGRATLMVPTINVGGAHDRNTPPSSIAHPSGEWTTIGCEQCSHFPPIDHWPEILDFVMQPGRDTTDGADFDPAAARTPAGNRHTQEDRAPLRPGPRGFAVRPSVVAVRLRHSVVRIVRPLRGCRSPNQCAAVCSWQQAPRPIAGPRCRRQAGVPGWSVAAYPNAIPGHRWTDKSCNAFGLAEHSEGGRRGYDRRVIDKALQPSTSETDLTGSNHGETSGRRAREAAPIRGAQMEEVARELDGIEGVVMFEDVE